MQENGAEIKNRHGGLVAAMGGSNALGIFADNFFKQCLVLIAAYAGAAGGGSFLANGAGGEDIATTVQSVATVLYSLPFIICSAWAGWLADRCVKKNIILCAKITEFISLLFGAYALFTGWWAGMLLVVFCMGLQTTFFSPALNGTIPELFSSAMVPRVNSYIKLASTVAVLLGMGCAGFILELRPDFAKEYAYDFGRAASGVCIVAISFLGLAVSFAITRHPLAHKADNEPFPWSGPLRSFKNFWNYRRDPELFLVFWAEAVFYAVSVIIVICIVNLSQDLGYSPTTSSLLTACIMIGIAAGALVAGRFDVYSWRRFAVPSSLGLGCMIALVFFIPYIQPEPLLFFTDARLASFFTVIFVAGIFGGMYLIPIASFIQAHPPANEKGKALGVSNFFSFVGMTASAPVFYGLSALGPASWTFLAYGIFTVIFSLFVLVPGVKKYCGSSLYHKGNCLLGELVRGILSTRYAIQETGLTAISTDPRDKRPFLFLPNHTALIDPVMVYSRIMGISPTALIDSHQLRGGASVLKRLFGFIEIADLAKDGRKGVHSIRHGLDTMVRLMKNGESVLLYPSGRLTLNGHEWLGGNSAVQHVLQAVPNARVVLVRHSGLWGSSFSYASGKTPRPVRILLKAVVIALVNGLFFVPKRKVQFEFTEVEDFPRRGSRMEINAYLERFYEERYQEAFTVPHYFWQGSTPQWVNRAVQEEKAGKSGLPVLRIDGATRKRIYTLLARKAGKDVTIEDSMRLGRDLGLDSLDVLELAARAEIEFGCVIDSFEYITTVGDFLGAVAGVSRNKKLTEFKPPRRWFSPSAFADAERFVSVPSGKNLVEAFIGHVKSYGSLPLVAEKSTIFSRTDVLARALVLREEFLKIPHDRVGVMLPPSATAIATWLGLQMAGKIPVFINWSLGQRYVEAALHHSGVKEIITTQGFYDRIIYWYEDLSQLSRQIINIDNILANVGMTRNLRHLIKARLMQWGGYGSEALTALVPDTAVILFTSGSESIPKRVPLSHGNLITNIEDVRKALNLKQRYSVLAVLPPYHSFGFLLGIGLPCGLGLPSVCHANVKESFTIAALAKAYCPNLLGGTPAVVEGLLAYGAEYLHNFEYIFSGGEKCPEHLLQEIARVCPQAVVSEGYGVTECSPVISLNPPDAIRKGSMGKPVESVITAIVSLETPLRRLPVGTAGQLLVRGASVFKGYDDESLNASAFVDFENERWFKTGDLIVQDEDGYLYHKGRLARFAKAGGEMISLPLIEDTVNQALPPQQLHGSDTPALVVMADDQPSGEAVLTAVTTLDLDVDAINKILRHEGLPALYAIQSVRRVQAIPLLGNGKVDFISLSEDLKD